MSLPSDLEVKIATFFEGQVCVAVIDPSVVQPALIGREGAVVAKAVPKRRQEFAAGCAAARIAMKDLGVTPTEILAGPDRAPIWPMGVVGSISHTDQNCIAVVAQARTLRSVGIDIEKAAPLDANLSPMICSDLEQARIAGPDQAHLAKLIFSAKEAAYKAQYSLTTLVFGFKHFNVDLDVANGTFRAMFLKPATPYRVGDTLPGRFVRVADHLVTAVTIGQDTPEGA